MNRSKKFLFTSFLLLILSGNLFAEPPAAEFHSLTLQDCYQLALKQSETVAIRQQEIETAKSQMFTAASQGLGDIDFVMTNSRQEPQEVAASGGSVGSTLTASERRERKFKISQPLFQGFKSYGAIVGAGSLKKQRGEEKKRAEELLFLDVADAYYGVFRYRKDTEILEGIQHLYQERVGELNEREQIGRSRVSEIATAQARMKILEAKLAIARASLRVAQHGLSFLTGLEMNAGLLREEDVPNPTDTQRPFSLEGAEERADVEAARQAVKTAKQGIVVAQSGLWPEITLDSNLYEKREGFQSGIDWDVLFTIKVPLFKGGETVGEIKQAMSEWKKAKYSYSLAERQAEFEIKEAYEYWVASLQESKLLEDARAASEENFRLQKEDYLRSLVNNLDVLEALESLQDTRREAVRAHYEMKENYWQLAVATGRLNESL